MLTHMHSGVLSEHAAPQRKSPPAPSSDDYEPDAAKFTAMVLGACVIGCALFYGLVRGVVYVIGRLR